MASNEKTSAQVAAIASRALQNPSSVTPEEVKQLAASVLAQAPDRQRQQQPSQGSPAQRSQQNPSDQPQRR